MPQGMQQDAIPLGRTRGALSKEDLLKMQESITINDEDKDASDLRERMNKTTKKRKKPTTRQQKTKTTKRTSKQNSEYNAENQTIDVDEDDGFIHQEDVETVVQKVPELVDAYLILRNSQEQLKALQSSQVRVDDMPVLTNNENTIVVGFRNKPLTAQPVKFKIFRNDTFLKPLENYLKTKAPSKTPNQCILKFDGDIVDLHKTPNDILIDNFDIMDVIFVEAPQSNNNTDNITSQISASVVILDDDASASRLDLQRATTTNLTPTELPVQEKVKIKVRVDGGEIHKFMVSKTDPFGKLIRGLSEKLNCKPAQVKLIFDGMSVKETSTPEDLDMEDGDLIDANVK